MIHGTLGRLGKGKTLSMVLKAYEYYCLGWKIFSNIWLKFPFVPIKTPYDIITLENCFALLDEFWALADNRKSMSLKNDVVTVVCIRSRKRKFHIGYTQQYVQIDPRIRFITDYWIRPKLYPDNLTGLPPVILEQKIYDGDWIPQMPITIDVRPYLNLYDTDLDPYTLSASVSDENLKAALEKALENDPTLREDMEKLKQKAVEKEEKEKHHSSLLK
jgi:hypothetical protein